MKIADFIVSGFVLSMELKEIHDECSSSVAMPYPAVYSSHAKRISGFVNSTIWSYKKLLWKHISRNMKIIKKHILGEMLSPMEGNEGYFPG
jgi:hypothetical protein